MGETSVVSSPCVTTVTTLMVSAWTVVAPVGNRRAVRAMGIGAA